MSPRSNRRGATLIEAVLAILVLGIAIPPLVGMFREVAARSADGTYQQVAVTCAESLLEEIASRAFEDPDVLNGSFGAEEGSRSSFDDVDDYDGLNESPPARLDGTPLDDYGGLVRTATVDNVTAADPDPVTAAADGSTDCKRIRVKVTWTGARGGELTLSTLRTRVCGTADPLDEIASAATPVKRSAQRCDLELWSSGPCDATLASFALSAGVPTSALSQLKLDPGATTIWTGSVSLPTGTTALNAGSATDRTIPAGGNPALQITFATSPTGTIPYTLVLTFTDGTSSTIPFIVAW